MHIVENISFLLEVYFDMDVLMGVEKTTKQIGRERRREREGERRRERERGREM